MSTGQIVGVVAGAVIGFVIGGPVGAMWGAAIGFGLGSALGTQPDSDVPGMQPQEMQINLAKEGTILPDILGTPKCVGHIIWHYVDGDRVVEETEEQAGGKGGGSQEIITGYEYFATWAVGLCMGPVDKLFTIYKDDKVAWHGELSCPVSGGKETISITGMGSVDFYFGTADHEVSSYMSERVSDSTKMPAYRNQCFAIFKDCSIGATNRVPSMSCILQKTPTVAPLSDADKDIETYDYNASHAIAYVMTEMIGISSAYIDSGSFEAAATKFRAESIGLSIHFGQTNSGMTYVESILQHVGAMLRYSGEAKWHLHLWRADEAVAGLPSIDESVMLDEPSLTRKTWLETLNQVNIQYSRRIFRVALCPSGCDNFAITLPTGGIGEDYTLACSIQNSKWTDSPCSDLSYLSDGMPVGKQGTFDNLVYDSAGRWTFDYTSHVDLCDDNIIDPICPIICGVEIKCCGCAIVEDIEADEDNPETMGADDSIELVVEGGIGPYTWTVESGDLASSFSFTAGQTSGKSNFLNSNGAACGYVVVRCSETCGSYVDITIRCTVGQWNTMCSQSTVEGSCWPNIFGGSWVNVYTNSGPYRYYHKVGCHYAPYQCNLWDCGVYSAFIPNPADTEPNPRAGFCYDTCAPSTGLWYTCVDMGYVNCCYLNSHLVGVYLWGCPP